MQCQCLPRRYCDCVKGLTAAEASAKSGAVLIICAELADGCGGENFYQDFRNCVSPEAFFDSCTSTPQEETVPDQWQSQILARILMKHKVIFVSRPEMKRVLEEMKLHYCATLEEALTLARREKGEEASVTLIPNGVSVIVQES